MSGKPTWKAAVGTERGQYKLWNGTVQTSAKNGGHKTLKYRKTGQNNLADVKQRDLNAELRHKETGTDPLLNIAAAAAAAAAAAVAASSSSVGAVPSNDLDRDDDSEEGAPIAASSSRSAPVDADDHSESGEAANSSSDSDDDSDDDDDDDSHDETAELMRELARIKQEREAERIKLEQEKLMRDARDNEDAVLRSNPLLNSDSDARGGDLASDSVLKRKWFEETAFKNQAKVEDPKKAKRFINDTVRSDFHVRFLERYVK